MPLLYCLQPLVSLSVSLGVELAIDHEPGHSNVLADGLSRYFHQIMSQFGPNFRVHVSIAHLLSRERNWTLCPEGPDWPKSLTDNLHRKAQKPGGVSGCALGAVCRVRGRPLPFAPP